MLFGCEHFESLTIHMHFLLSADLLLVSVTGYWLLMMDANTATFDIVCVCVHRSELGRASWKVSEV